MDTSKTIRKIFQFLHHAKIEDIVVLGLLSFIYYIKYNENIQVRTLCQMRNNNNGVEVLFLQARRMLRIS